MIDKKKLKIYLIGVVSGTVIAAGAYHLLHRIPPAGPYGGDLVSFDRGNAYAEVLTNAATGEAIVHTWEPGLKQSRPIATDPIVLGSGNERVTMMPYPAQTDPSGSCSRFYGPPDWLRGGSIHHGWLHWHGQGEPHQFAWGRCWDAGRAHGLVWHEMNEHRRMGPGHGAEHHGGIPHD